MTNFWRKHRPFLVDWLPYLILSGWLLYTRPTIWLDETALRYASDWYTIPYGPLYFLFPLTEGKIRALSTVLPLLNILGLIAFCIPVRRLRITGGFLTAIAGLIIDGINYSSGKIDHQAISHSLPALI